MGEEGGNGMSGKITGSIFIRTTSEKQDELRKHGRRLAFVFGVIAIDEETQAALGSDMVVPIVGELQEHGVSIRLLTRLKYDPEETVGHEVGSHSADQLFCLPIWSC